MWQQTRWPGHYGRVLYAHTLFNLYVLRRLMLLAMRVWDAGARRRERLAQIQGVLDELWRTTPADQPVFVRDARWLFPLAQSPTTDELAAYFEVAKQIAETLADEDRLEIHKASVRMAGGHLRSQLRHVSHAEGRVARRQQPDSEHAQLQRARSGDADSRSRAAARGLRARRAPAATAETRLELAGAICQGISPDPELFLNRLDLLGPYSMIEHLFITTDRDGHAVYTPMGQRHVQLLKSTQRGSVECRGRCTTTVRVSGRLTAPTLPMGCFMGFRRDSSSTWRSRRHSPMP